jgi:3alpha(or 20beta)-hydroxysteroid dehydrogenase
MGRLDGKVALISGGARGMGEAEARLFASEGARVVIGDILEDHGRRVAAEIGDESARAVRLDVTEEDSWLDAVSATTEAFGRLDILVNNAGIFRIAPLAMTSAEEYMQVVKVNQLGVFLGMKSVIQAMIASGGGSIINISSVAGLIGGAAQTAYGASKWAVRGMTKTAALELASFGIRVNSIHPGLVDTELLRPLGIDFDSIAEGIVPAGRMATADDVAPLALYLASDESRYSTGSEFVVDGGMTAGLSPRAGQ